jgi:hypothetical protein
VRLYLKFKYPFPYKKNNYRVKDRGEKMEENGRVLLLRVVAPSLADIEEFYRRLVKVYPPDSIQPTGVKPSEREPTWRGYFKIRIADKSEEDEDDGRE